MSREAEDLAKRYGLEPTPESVMRLTKLVSRQDADLDQIARVIAQDKALTARLLRAANPDAMNEADYDITTVDQALMRTGMGCVLLLAMRDPLQRGVTRTFQTMLTMKIEGANSAIIPAFEGDQMIGQVGFAGAATGLIRLIIPDAAARLIASRMLGMEPKELTDFAVVSDCVGEVVNIVAGNFKSNLCDAGLDCKLDAPVIERTSDVPSPVSRGQFAERIAFKTSELVFVVDICVDPWTG